MFEPQDNFDQTMQDYLNAELRGQLGAAERGFRAARSPLPVIAWSAAGLLAAAALAVTWMLWPESPAAPQRPSLPSVAQVEPVKPVPAHQAVVQVNEITWNRILDDRIVTLDGRNPVRRIQRQVIQEVDTYNPSNGQITQELHPTEEVILTPVPTF